MTRDELNELRRRVDNCTLRAPDKAARLREVTETAARHLAFGEHETAAPFIAERNQLRRWLRAYNDERTRLGLALGRPH